MDEQLTIIGNGAPKTEPVVPPIMYAPRPKRSLMWVPISIAVVMALLAITFAGLLFFARQDLGATDRRVADLKTTVSETQEQNTALEGDLNGAQLRLNSLQASAESCITGLQKAVDVAQAGALSVTNFVDKWLDSLELEEDVKRDCNRATSLAGSLSF